MSQQNSKAGFNTLAVHAGVKPDPSTGAIMTPVFMSSTYVQEGIGQHKGYEYSRSSNPTRDALEAAFAALEGGTHGLAFSSGLAAVDAVMMTLKPGDEVIAGDDLYGGTRRLFATHYAPLGIQFHFVDTQEAVHGAGHGADVVLDGPQRGVDLCILGHEGPHDHIGMASEVFGDAVHHDVGTQGERVL